MPFPYFGLPRQLARVSKRPKQSTRPKASLLLDFPRHKATSTVRPSALRPSRSPSFDSEDDDIPVSQMSQLPLLSHEGPRHLQALVERHSTLRNAPPSAIAIPKYDRLTKTDTGRRFHFVDKHDNPVKVVHYKVRHAKCVMVAGSDDEARIIKHRAYPGVGRDTTPYFVWKGDDRYKKQPSFFRKFINYAEEPAASDLASDDDLAGELPSDAAEAEDEEEDSFEDEDTGVGIETDCTHDVADAANDTGDSDEHTSAAVSENSVSASQAGSALRNVKDMNEMEDFLAQCGDKSCFTTVIPDPPSEMTWLGLEVRYIDADGSILKAAKSRTVLGTREKILIVSGDKRTPVLLRHIRSEQGGRFHSDAFTQYYAIYYDKSRYEDKPSIRRVWTNLALGSSKARNGRPTATTVETVVGGETVQTRMEAEALSNLGRKLSRPIKRCARKASPPGLSIPARNPSFTGLRSRRQEYVDNTSGSTPRERRYTPEPELGSGHTPASSPALSIPFAAPVEETSNTTHHPSRTSGRDSRCPPVTELASKNRGGAQLTEARLAAANAAQTTGKPGKRGLADLHEDDDEDSWADWDKASVWPTKAAQVSQRRQSTDVEPGTSKRNKHSHQPVDDDIAESMFSLDIRDGQERIQFHFHAPGRAPRIRSFNFCQNVDQLFAQAIAQGTIGHATRGGRVVFAGSAGHVWAEPVVEGDDDDFQRVQKMIKKAFAGMQVGDLRVDIRAFMERGL